MFGHSAMAVDPTLSSITTKQKSSRELVQDALDANKRLQQSLIQRAEQLEADLKEADSLLVSQRSIILGISSPNIGPQGRKLPMQMIFKMTLS